MADSLILRTFAFIDNMQPQYAALTGTVVKGDPCLESMAQLYIEMTPGSSIYKLLDAALKRSNAKPGFLIVEREYGELELHSANVEDVMEAGNEILSQCGLTIQDRMRPKIVSEQIITKVDPFQAQLINRSRHGSMLLPSQNLLILECEPAGYISIAANEAEKNADITIIHFDPVGKYGRMYLAGDIAAVTTARDAAIRALENTQGSDW